MMIGTKFFIIQLSFAEMKWAANKALKEEHDYDNNDNKDKRWL